MALLILVLTLRRRKLFYFLFVQKAIVSHSSNCPVQLLSIFNLEQRPSFPRHFVPNDSLIRNQSSGSLGHLPFLEMREFNMDFPKELRSWTGARPCPHRGAVLLQEINSMDVPHEVDCRPFGSQIRNSLPFAMNK
jgi:hypothetical protein